ncbi:acetyl-CoA C-acetyltransferase [Sphingobium faniae]|nr:acetyl-CoA C-acetyltransferase [Sphingobium faniae]
MLDPQNIPVIVGIGEITDRDNGKEPRALIVEAARLAGADAPGLLEKLDSIDVVSIVSWVYKDIAQVVADDLGVRVSHAAESVAGGEKPIRLLGEIAERIARGETQVALLCGGEATRTRVKAAQAGQTLEWGPTNKDAKPISALDFVTPHAARYGLLQPPTVYPLYENRTRHVWNQSAAEADRESATLWSRYSAAAARNPFAWITRPHNAEQIAQDSADNRMISYPYRKLMVANPSVNQGAAILVTSLAKAREAGVPEDRIVYIWSGARAKEPDDFLQRDRYDRSTAQNSVLDTTVAMANRKPQDFDLIEFYSCFPTVPKMARRTLGLGEDVQPSITGGLTFFGGPANNFMSHAIAAAVRHIRAGEGHNALLYGQGEFVTKHAAIVLADSAPAATPEMRDVQEQADSAAEAVPPLLENYEGPAEVESFTVVYDRTGNPAKAPIITRTPAGERVVALVDPADAEGIAILTEGDRHPIGRTGAISQGKDGLLQFRFG